MSEPKVPRLRRRPVPSGALVVVVRGDDADPGSDRHQAMAFCQRFSDWGRYGVSGYFAEDDAGVDDLAADQLERFPILRVYALDALQAAGLDVHPTFRTPHVTIAFTDLEAGLAALEALEHERRQNPYHEA